MMSVSPVLSREALAALDRVDQIGACWASVADLLAGDEPDTNKLADLLGFLSREYSAARDGLHACLMTDSPALSREALAALDRVDQLGACWASVADLLAGDEPDTNKLADLLGFLSREYSAARDGLHACLMTDIQLSAGCTSSRHARSVSP